MPLRSLNPLAAGEATGYRASAKMPPNAAVSDIARVIQLAVAPVFLLTAVGTILGVLSGRLGRIVDRARVLIDRMRSASPEDRRRLEEELSILVRRRHLVNMAITAGVTTALLVCLVIVAAFVGYIAQVHVATVLAILFIGAMLAFMAALVLFLREIMVAVLNLRFEVQ
jgi:hypothetical protein